LWRWAGSRGKYAAEAPKAARERFGFDIVEAFYEDFEKRIRDALKDPARGALARRWAERYLAMPGTALETERKFVKNAFVLYGAFMDLMEETGAAAFTIGSCMGTIMPMAETTACLTLSLMNDEGTPAFCESDFVIIPMRQEVTFIDPEYATARWVGMRGVVERNPFYDICR
jgi:L-fucose isomerase-like protein